MIFKQHSHARLIPLDSKGILLLDFGKTYETRKSRFKTFIKASFVSWWKVSLIAIVVNLVGIYLNLFVFGNEIVLGVPLLFGLYLGWCSAVSVNDDVESCINCQGTRFYLSQEECLGHTVLHTENKPDGDSRDETNHMVSRSVISCRCSECDLIQSSGEVLHH
ncbi:hypothetical protein P7F88_03750 [Vibrio hannami]|uniref:hypothetical protein n=1 Tax=Vibrio hannami TaxID=2717094 RepID=UPI0024103733|nr:hypothetical protein [Vibrio hannami]MDG3085263.1 hypothetical protein [Vibrio hannami]